MSRNRSEKRLRPETVLIPFFREFDPGSGRTLAACLTHASRTEISAEQKEACFWKFLLILVADGRVTRE